MDEALRKLAQSVQVIRGLHRGTGGRDINDIAENALPMDQKSRMKRAKQQGYDLKHVVYHGTDVDIKDINPNLYVSRDPGTAEVYARKHEYDEQKPEGYVGPNIMPLYVKKGADRVTRAIAGYRMVLNPEDVRSVHAAFDPQHAGKSGLMLKNGGSIPVGDPRRDENLAQHMEGNHPDVPHVVYHGSPDIRGILAEGFKPHSRGDVHFATDSYPMANSYADDRRAFDYQNAEPQVIPLHLSLKNPMVIDAQGRHWKETEKHVAEAKAKGHDGLIIKNSVDYYNNPSRSGAAGNVFAWFKPTQAKSAIQGQLKSRIDNKPIPDATGNNGNFDPSNPDITKARGGSVDQIHGIHVGSNVRFTGAL